MADGGHIEKRVFSKYTLFQPEMTAKMLILSRFIQYCYRKTFLIWSEPNQYSKWRPAAILDFQKVQISAIFHFHLVAADDNMISLDNFDHFIFNLILF